MMSQELFLRMKESGMFEDEEQGSWGDREADYVMEWRNNSRRDDSQQSWKEGYKEAGRSM